jgi:hypothetical protein
MLKWYLSHQLFEVMRRPAMRTTLDIRDDVLEQVKAYAAARSISQGSAASELIQRGLRAEVPTVWENGLLVFDPGPDAQVVTLEKTLELEDALEDDFA